MKTLRTSRALAALGLALACVGQAMAQAPASADPNASRALHARQLAANCAACHGTDGRTVQGSPVAALAGTPSARMQEVLREFKEGKREATIMHQIAKGLTDEQMKTLADYFAAQKP